jgi:hypothetical protein
MAASEKHFADWEMKVVCRHSQQKFSIINMYSSVTYLRITTYTPLHIPLIQ